MTPAILHVIPAGGGGTERFVRDLVAALPTQRHLLLHVGPDGNALEEPLSGRYLGLRAPPADAFGRYLAALLGSHTIGLVHLHLIGASTKDWIDTLPLASVPWLITLHDLGFLSPRLFALDASEPVVDPDWVARLRPLVAGAQAITSPSGFIDQRFAACFPAAKLVRVEPGLTWPTLSFDNTAAELPTVGLIGAFGRHKGLERLEAVWADPRARAVRWVLIGYTEHQLQPSQRSEPTVLIHGPFEPSEAVALIERYQIDLMWFPNRLAESFSYALSEAWAAARPVLVPANGALAERVGAHGGGWISAASDAAAALDEILVALPQARAAGVRAEALQQREQRVPSIVDMAAACSDVYAKIAWAAPATEGAPWAATELQAWLESQLGPLTFRHENIRLARDYAQVRTWAEQLAVDVADLRSDRDHWQAQFSGVQGFAAHLQADVSQLQGELRATQLQAADLSAHWQAAREQFAADAVSRQQQIATLQAALDTAQTTLAQVLAEQARESAAWQVIAREHGLIDPVTDQLGALREWLTVDLARRRRMLEELQQLTAAQSAELIPLRIKGSRYDRLLGLIPGFLQRGARWLVRRWRHRTV